MSYLFVTPTVWEGPSYGPRLFAFYEFKRGVTVYRVGSQFGEIRFPSQDFLETVDEYWMGGHTHEVSNSTAADLTAAGYGDYLTEIV